MLQMPSQVWLCPLNASPRYGTSPGETLAMHVAIL